MSAVTNHCLRSHSKAHRPARTTLQRPMHYPRIREKIQTRPWVPLKELVRQHVTLSPVAGTTCGNHVAGCVHATLCDWENVVQRRYLRIEADAAIHAAVGAVPQSRAFERSLVSGVHVRPRATH